MADKLAELELISNAEIEGENDERVMMLGYMRELELLRQRAKFEQLSRELVVSLENNDAERMKLLNGAVNGAKRDLSILEKTGSRDDFAGLFTIWDKLKSNK